MYYEAGISYIDEYQDAKGKLRERKKSEKFLLRATSITDAEAKLKEKIKNVYNNYTIKYVKESVILSVFE